MRAVGDVNSGVVVVVIVNHLDDSDGEVHSEGIVQHEAEEDHYVQHLDAC